MPLTPSIAQLTSSLTAALQRIGALEREVSDLRSKQDVIAVDVAQHQSRLDGVEMAHEAGGEPQQDWWDEDAA